MTNLAAHRDAVKAEGQRWWRAALAGLLPVLAATFPLSVAAEGQPDLPIAVAEGKAADEPETAPWSHRYRMLLEGKPWRDFVVQAYRDEDGNHVSETRQFLLHAEEGPSSPPLVLLRRLPDDPGDKPPILVAHFVETPSGTPLYSDLLSYSEGEPYGVRCRFTEGGVELYRLDPETGEIREKLDASRAPVEPGWLTLVGEERLLAKAIRQGTKNLRYRTFDPIEDYGAKTIHAERVGEEVLETAKGSVATTIWKVEKERTPPPNEPDRPDRKRSEELQWLDAEGRVVYLESSGFGYPHTLIRSDLGDARPREMTLRDAFPPAPGPSTDR